MREYTAWPRTMRRSTAAAYLDMGEAEFERAVFAGKLPMPSRVGDRDRWSKDQIDAAIAAMTGEAGAARDWRSEQPLYRDAPNWRDNSKLYAGIDWRTGKPKEQPAKSEEPPRRAYSPATLAKRWSCSASLIRSMIKRGELAAFRYGKGYRITADEVDRVEQVEK